MEKYGSKFFDVLVIEGNEMVTSKQKICIVLYIEGKAFIIKIDKNFEVKS